MFITFLLESQISNEYFIFRMIFEFFYGFFMSFIELNLFKQLFKLKINKLKIFELIVINGVLRYISFLLIKEPYYKATHIIFSILMCRYGMKQSLVKSTLFECLNEAIVIISEMIFSKVFYITYLDNINYIFRVQLCVALVKLLVYFIIKHNNITFNISRYLNKKNKANIITFSMISIVIMFLNSVEITFWINDVPYICFFLNIISLVILFCIGILNVISINDSEVLDLRIHELENYNKTLIIMYDSIRCFRHDFSNFVLALDGYARTDNIEGIREMSRPILKECQMVNSMGILDPEIINNAAIYSILTNKYYLAKEQNINMNIEILVDIEDKYKYCYEICRILGILLDNAIEAAKECEDKIINVRFVKDSKVNRKLIIIENSYFNKNLDIDKLFEKGYTTKLDAEAKHGLGLWKVKNILKANEYLNLYTAKGELFSQQLEIYN